MLSFGLFSQNPVIMKIWQTYNTAKTNVQAQINGDIPEDHYQFILNQNLPAIGPQTITYDYYFSLVDKYDDPDYYDQNEEFFDQEVYFVEKTYNVAANEFHEEFLFENEKLIYYFYKENSGNCYEIRIYFNNNKMVRFSKTNLNSDNCEDITSQVEYGINNLPDDYNATIEKAQEDAIYIIKIFDFMNAY